MAAVIKASDVVLIPVQPSPYDVWTTSSLVEAIKQRQELGARLVAYFVVSRAIQNTKLESEVKDALLTYELPTLKVVAVQRVAYSSSAAIGETVFQTGDEKAKTEVLHIARELLEVE